MLCDSFEAPIIGAQHPLRLFSAAQPSVCHICQSGSSKSGCRKRAWCRGFLRSSQKKPRAHACVKRSRCCSSCINWHSAYLHSCRWPTARRSARGGCIGASRTHESCTGQCCRNVHSDHARASSSRPCSPSDIGMELSLGGGARTTAIRLGWYCLFGSAASLRATDGRMYPSCLLHTSSGSALSGLVPAFGGLHEPLYLRPKVGEDAETCGQRKREHDDTNSVKHQHCKSVTSTQFLAFLHGIFTDTYTHTHERQPR